MSDIEIVFRILEMLRESGLSGIDDTFLNALEKLPESELLDKLVQKFLKDTLKPLLELKSEPQKLVDEFLESVNQLRAAGPAIAADSVSAPTFLPPGEAS